MAGLVPAIPVGEAGALRAEMAGTRPAMTGGDGGFAGFPSPERPIPAAVKLIVLRRGVCCAPGSRHGCPRALIVRVAGAGVVNSKFLSHGWHRRGVGISNSKPTLEVKNFLVQLASAARNSKIRRARLLQGGANFEFTALVPRHRSARGFFVIKRHLEFLVILAGLGTAFAHLPARAQDASDVVVRLSQLEEQMRHMSGKIEELEFQNRQLRDQLKRFQEDTEFRFQDGGKGSGQASTPRAAPAAPMAPLAPAAPPRQIALGTPPAPAAPRGPSRADVFDPQAAPGAPGAPRQLGAADSAAPAPRRAPASPPGSIMEDPGEPRGGAGSPLDLGGSGAPSPVPGSAPRPPQSSVASTGTDSVKADFDNAYAFIQQRQFEQAEMGFRSFLQSHPRSKLVSDATYWLGESYLQRARYRDAAEQFLKITTSYGSSNKGPDGMLKLGVSLRGLGANDQACATFAEVSRKYPTARPALLKDVQREQQRSKCPA